VRHAALPGKTPQMLVKPAHQKYFTFPKFGFPVFPIPSHPVKGAVRESSRNAGRDAVDAGSVGAKGFRRAGFQACERSASRGRTALDAYGKTVWT